MSYAPVRYVATAGQREFDVTFPYLAAGHVRVSVSSAPTAFDWVSPTRISLLQGATVGAAVVLTRNTPMEPLVTFTNGSNLTQEELNLAVRQVLYAQQELLAKWSGTVEEAEIRLGDNLGIVTDPESVADQLAQIVMQSAVLSDFADRITDIDSNAQALIEQTLRVDDLQSIVEGLTELQNGGAAVTLILTEQVERIEGDAALAATSALIGAANGNNTAFILDLNTVRVDANTTLSQRFSSLSATDAANAAAITTEATARTNADSAAATQITALQATTASNAAAIITEQSARAAGDAASATQLAVVRAEVLANTTSVVAASVGTEASARVAGDTAISSLLTVVQAQSAANNAAIGTELTVRADADAALASSLSLVNTTVAGHTATIATQASSINGLEARYGVSLNVNGYITGFVQNNSGTSGSFAIMADVFSVVDPGGGVPYVPFEISGGVTRIKNALITNLDLGALGSGFFNGVMNVGTGRIVFDNGIVMKVMGVGFGTTNQFIEWFGPKMAISLCSEANATQYLKTNGSAYFGGALHAGALTSAASTSTLLGTYTLPLAPFGSNGNAITVACSYSLEGLETFAQATHFPAPTYVAAPTVVLELWRKLGAGAWTKVVGPTTYTGVGTRTDEGFDGTWNYTTTTALGASFTYTDPTLSTANREYELRLISRNATPATTQRMSIISSEQ